MNVLWKSLSINSMFEVCEGEDVAEARAVGINAVVRDERASDKWAKMRIGVIFTVKYGPWYDGPQEVVTYLCFRT